MTLNEDTGCITLPEIGVAINPNAAFAI